MNRNRRLMGRYGNWRTMRQYEKTGAMLERIDVRRGAWTPRCWKFSSPPNNEVFAPLIDEVFFRRAYCPEGFEIRADDIVVDVGANIGIFTVFAASQSRHRVIAVEPFPDNFKYLMLNCESNGLDHVHCIEAALTGESGRAKLYDSGSSGGHLLFDHNNNGRLTKYILVPTITLRSLVAEHRLPRIDFLKMDCEGAEGDILQSLEVADFLQIDRLAMEFHDNVSSLKHDKIEQLLVARGYEVRLVWDGASPFGYLYAGRGRRV